MAACLSFRGIRQWLSCWNRAHNLHLPARVLSGHGLHGRERVPVGHPTSKRAQYVRYNDESDSTTLSLQVGVPLMIYDRNQGNIMRAQAELMAAQQNVQRVELLLQDQLAEAFREFEVARDQVAQYRQGILPDAKKSLELTRAGYQQSEFGYLELLTAQQTYSRTTLAYIARLRELWLSAVQIDGMLLSGGLQAPDVR